jgi:serine/threonine protein kinase
MCLGRTLFSCETREELFLAHCQLLTPPQATRFAGGRYSRDLFALVSSSQAGAPPPLPSHGDSITFSDHYRKIYDLLLSPHLNNSSSAVSSLSTIFPSDLIHLIASLLYPDPDLRLNIQDALQHSFVSSFIQIPMSLWSNSGHGHQNKLKGRKRKHSASVETLRTSKVHSISNGCHSMNAEMKEREAQEEEEDDPPGSKLRSQRSMR